jgi:hypothetical protein
MNLNNCDAISRSETDPANRREKEREREREIYIYIHMLLSLYGAYLVIKRQRDSPVMVLFSEILAS